MEVVASTSARWIGVAGLVGCGLAIVAIAIASAPEADASDEKLLDRYGNSGNQVRFLASSVVIATSLMAIIIFVVGLKRLLAEAGAPGVLVDVTLVAGVLTCAVGLVAAAVGASLAVTLVFSDTYKLDPNGARLILTAGNIWLSAIAGIPAALLLASASLAARRSRALPSWLVWLGFVLTPLVFLAFPGFGANLSLFLLWVLVTSLVLLLRRPLVA
jgi:hypothetical protein